jgi:hypothetical protein
MNSKTLYFDKLIELDENTICFRHYYFPIGSKTVSLKKISRIVILKPSMWNGKWRIHGTGGFKVWFPCDWKRPMRKKIYIALLHGKWWQIGFTVEDPESFERAIQSKVEILRN